MIFCNIKYNNYLIYLYIKNNYNFKKKKTYIKYAI